MKMDQLDASSQTALKYEVISFTRAAAVILLEALTSRACIRPKITIPADGLYNLELVNRE